MMIDSFSARIQDLPLAGVAANKRTAVSIRQAVTAADAVAIAELCRHGFSTTHHNALAKSDMTRYLTDTFNRLQITSEMNKTKMRFLVAEAVGKIVGTIRLGEIKPPHPILLPASMELSRLYLQPQWVGAGVGSALMRRALEITATAGFKSCWLTVWEGNGRAIDFYRRWQFRPVGEETLQVGQSAPVGLVMFRLL